MFTPPAPAYMASLVIDLRILVTEEQIIGKLGYIETQEPAKLVVFVKLMDKNRIFSTLLGSLTIGTGVQMIGWCKSFFGKVWGSFW